MFLLIACATPVAAPEDLDGLFHWFFLNYTSGTDEEILAAAANLAPLAAAVGRGTVSDLDDAELATLPELVSGLDPEDATGIFISGPVDCPHASFEEIHYALDQEGIYETATGEESYIAYDRVYTEDIAAYEARAGATLSWDTTYTIQPVLSEYTAHIDGGMRYVAAADGVGPVVIERASLPEPATFTDEASADYFAQDYQLDLMLPDGDTTVHAYAVWRDLSSATLADESEGVQNIILDGLEDFDRDTELVCTDW